MVFPEDTQVPLSSTLLNVIEKQGVLEVPTKVKECEGIVSLQNHSTFIK